MPWRATGGNATRAGRNRVLAVTVDPANAAPRKTDKETSMKVRTAFTALLLTAAVACGGTPQPGDPGYEFNLNGEYDVQFDGDDGQSYSGTMFLTTEPGGTVSGSMALVSPMGIDGTMEGMIIGAQLELSVQFFIPDAQCGGMAASTAVITQGGDSAAGSADITPDAECGGPTVAVFTLTR
jgi:hypothetical protein